MGLHLWGNGAVVSTCMLRSRAIWACTSDRTQSLEPSHLAVVASGSAAAVRQAAESLLANACSTCVSAHAARRCFSCTWSWVVASPDAVVQLTSAPPPPLLLPARSVKTTCASGASKRALASSTAAAHHDLRPTELLPGRSTSACQQEAPGRSTCCASKGTSEPEGACQSAGNGGQEPSVAAGDAAAVEEDVVVAAVGAAAAGTPRDGAVAGGAVAGGAGAGGGGRP